MNMVPERLGRGEGRCLEMVAVGCGSCLGPAHAVLVCGMERTEPVDVCRHLMDALGCPKHFLRAEICFWKIWTTSS